MKQSSAVALLLFAFIPVSPGQTDVSTFKAEVRSTFVWGADASNGAVSSLIHDQLTNRDIPAFRYRGVEVSSRIGFERIALGRTGYFLGYTATIVNDTSGRVPVRYGGITIDGRAVSPLSIILSSNRNGHKDVKSKAEGINLEDLYCINSGFLLSENFFSPVAGESQVFFVDPGDAFTVTSVIRDPGHSAIRCSLKGCHPTGTIRYSIRVRGQDYIFVWPGQSVEYCGR
jgi:hypothetical protein